MAAKKAAAAEKKSAAPRGNSSLTPGTGSQRSKNRLIVLYGPPKTEKTGSCAELEGAKWIVSDSNCIPTLHALNRLPPDEDVYEVKSIPEANAILEEALAAAEAGTLNIPALVEDSITQFVDWHQEDVAKETGQRWLGDNAKNNGWQQFNVQFGHHLDLLARLAKYTHVIVIAHAKEKADLSKGAWGGTSLPPQMSLKLARLANWLLFKTKTERELGEGDAPPAVDDPYFRVEEARGVKRIVETVIHTRPYGLWMASVNASKLSAEEPANIRAMLEKEGLWS